MSSNNLLSIPSILESLAKTSSTNEKKKILFETKSELLGRVFNYAYNHFITFGVHKIDTSNLTYAKEQPPVWFNDYFELLNKLSKRELTGNAAKAEIMVFMTHSTLEYAKLIMNTIKKDLRIGVSIGIINKVYPNLLPEAICMGAMKFDEKRIEFPAYVDIKLDGIRCIATIGENVTLVSRNGKAFKNYPVIANELKMLELEMGLRFDGEITCGHFQDLMRTVSRKEDGIDLAKDAKYNIFDIQCDLPFNKRLEILQDLRNKISEKKLKHISIIEGLIVNDENELQTFYQKQLQKGYEGVIIKRLDGFYEYRRSFNWVKLKPEETEDLTIIDFEEGKGKYQNQLGAFICALSNSGRVRVGSGLQDSERKEFWKKRQALVGQTIEIKFQEKTRDGSLRFPVFIRFRPDK